jgi:hypothetical protein
MENGTEALIDDDLVAFLRGPTSAFLGSADAMGTPDATRIVGMTAIGEARLRILISAQAETARRNAVVGARVAVLVTDITSYRSVQWKGRVVAVEARSPGDTVLIDQHISAFRGSSEKVGISAAEVWKLFAIDGVPLTVEVEESWDQTPGPHAGHSIQAAR